jgi:para-aminobenzoate synthetase/4-amino-4-deoxychorismate lyase
MINNLVLRHAREDCWLRFSEPDEVIVARQLDEVEPLFNTIQMKVNEGYYAAGFISYEAAPGFDNALTVKGAGDFPLLCFGLYGPPESLRFLAPAASDSLVYPDAWNLSTSSGNYNDAIEEIKQRIEAGETYQVNYTLRQETGFTGNPWDLFLSFANGAPFGAFIDLDDYAICCASPELFFELHHGKVFARPMKGTARRGATLAEDLRQRQVLSQSTKDRAENIMIVDMIRNDIGKIAKIGSVNVDQAFHIEKYPTLWQMTSTVSAESTASVGEVMQALFPCASITGAPKVNTMEIISKLESSARNIYTGTIGFMSPDGDAQFNVAIRTALIDKRKGRLEYGVGGGIVWDSTAEKEYDECLLKAKVIRQPRFATPFSLIETLLWTSHEGYFLLDFHLNRLQESAEYFDFRLNQDDFAKTLFDVSGDCEEGRYKIRLLLQADGEIVTTSEKLDVLVDEPRSVTLADQPVDSKDVFLYHKTTNRQMFEQVRADYPDYDDVLLCNEKNEMTESTVANLVIKRGGELITPSLSCGLLPGTFRQYLLDTAIIQEGIVTIMELNDCKEIYLINSVRKWQRVVVNNAV